MESISEIWTVEIWNGPFRCATAPACMWGQCHTLLLFFPFFFSISSVNYNVHKCWYLLLLVLQYCFYFLHPYSTLNRFNCIFNKKKSSCEEKPLCFYNWAKIYFMNDLSRLNLQNNLWFQKNRYLQKKLYSCYYKSTF